MFTLSGIQFSRGTIQFLVMRGLKLKVPMVGSKVLVSIQNRLLFPCLVKSNSQTLRITHCLTTLAHQ